MIITLEPYALSLAEFRNLQSRVLLRRFRWVWLLTCAFGIVVFSSSRDPQWQLLGIFCIVYIPLFVPLWHLWKIRGPKVAHLTLEQHVSVDDEGLVLRSADGKEARIAWAHVDRIEEFGVYVLLFVGTLAYFPIPLRAFRSAADRDALLERGARK